MSLIILALLLAGVVVFVTKVMNGGTVSRGMFSYQKRVKMVFSGYVAVLLICMAVTMLFPPPGATDLKQVKDKDIDRESQQLYQMALAGRIEEVGPEFLGKKWDYDFGGQQLNLSTMDDGTMSMPVMVKRKTGDDGKIEVAYYRARYSMDGYDLTEQIGPPRIQLSGNTLTVLKPAKNKLKFTEFNSVYSVKQFTGESDTGHSSYTIGGTRILYLSIPENLELNPNNLDIQYVE
ncbi:hypothetical protein [Neobacillus sp. Marseille-QA0830]